MKSGTVLIAVMSVAAAAEFAARAENPAVWANGRPQARLVVPRLGRTMADIVQSTLNGHLGDAFGWSLPTATRADAPGLYVLVGNETNNTVLADLVGRGLKLDRTDLGDEGFRVLTHEAGDRRFIIVTANTAVGLKYGCQELMYFRIAATAGRATIDWPLDVRMKPAFAYRGVYMLPCWAAYDSLNAWKRVVKFHSELTINRNWFWLAGFPMLEQYGGQYKGTDLADSRNVIGLVDLCRAEGMKFYIGGGWFTWHHERHAGGSIERGIRYYLDMLELLPDAEGVYLEPAGEGRDADEATWRKRTDALRTLAETIWRDRPEFEFAIAIGRFNAKPYREAIHRIDDQRIYWWWCWGDPVREKALDEHPLMLRWHTVVRMSEFHGSNDPPKASEAALTGFATGYDPGQGFGNPWNGWAAMGVDRPREFHPYTMPFFSHQYLFRERCWNVNITDEQFAARLSRRLFDADVPAEAIRHYLALADACPEPREVDPDSLVVIDEFVARHANRGTPRNRDTFARMREALDGISRQRAETDNKP